MLVFCLLFCNIFFVSSKSEIFFILKVKHIALAISFSITTNSLFIKLWGMPINSKYLFSGEFFKIIFCIFPSKYLISLFCTQFINFNNSSKDIKFQ